jgi:hypothetical protein
VVPFPHQSDRRETEDEPQKPVEGKQKPDLSDGFIDITFVTGCGRVILSSQMQQPPEREPMLYTSDQIDRAQISGMMFHPVTGQYLEKNTLRFDEKTHCLIIMHSETIGWSVGHSGRSEVLPRIGDNKDHLETDFPLNHWEFAKKQQKGG